MGQSWRSKQRIEFGATLPANVNQRRLNCLASDAGLIHSVEELAHHELL